MSTLKERFDSKWPMVFSGNGQDQSRKIKEFLQQELLSLADEVEQLQKELDKESEITPELLDRNRAFFLAAALIRSKAAELV